MVLVSLFFFSLRLSLTAEDVNKTKKKKKDEMKEDSKWGSNHFEPLDVILDESFSFSGPQTSKNFQQGA